MAEPASIVLFRVGSGVLAFVSLGFGIPGVIGTVHLLRTRQVWTFLGFPTYGPGMFGAGFSAVHIVLFVAACALGVAGAFLLWLPGTAIAGGFIGLVAIAAQAVFWIAFALPFGPPLGVIAAVAILAGLWGALRR